MGTTFVVSGGKDFPSSLIPWAMSWCPLSWTHHMLASFDSSCYCTRRGVKMYPPTALDSSPSPCGLLEWWRHSADPSQDPLWLWPDTKERTAKDTDFPQGYQSHQAYEHSQPPRICLQISLQAEPRALSSPGSPTAQAAQNLSPLAANAAVRCGNGWTGFK